EPGLGEHVPPKLGCRSQPSALNGVAIFGVVAPRDQREGKHQAVRGKREEHLPWHGSNGVVPCAGGLPNDTSAPPRETSTPLTPLYGAGRESESSRPCGSGSAAPPSCLDDAILSLEKSRTSKFPGKSPCWRQNVARALTRWRALFRNVVG